jgi:hypothetical protein
MQYWKTKGNKEEITKMLKGTTEVTGLTQDNFPSAMQLS